MTSPVAPALLESFLALAEELHYTRAADRLHVAQPALTKRIQQLERTVGFPLFVRTRRSVRLTGAGDLLLPRARQALAALDEFAAAASRVHDGDAGRIRVGFSPSAPHHVLPVLMRAFRRRYPGVECVLSELPTDAQIEQLCRGDLDVGILRRPATVPDAVSCTTFLEEPFVAVLPRDHPLASKRSVTLGQLGAEPFVLISRRTVAAVHDQVLQACAAEGFSPASLREATHVHAVVSLVAAGSGVSVLPRSAAQVGVKEVVCRPLCRPAMVTVMAVAHLKHGAPAAARALAAAATRRFVPQK